MTWSVSLLPPHQLPRDLGVLMVGINYWPEETGNAPYTTGLAERLAGGGCHVTVLTGMPYYPAWRVHDGYQRQLRGREERNGVAIRRFRQYVPPRQTAARRAVFEASFLLQGLTARGIDQPDVVIGVVPSLSGAGLAAAIAKHFRVPFGLIFQDLVGGAAAQSGMPGGKRVAGATRAVEGWCACRASAVAVVSEGFRDYLTALGVDPGRIVHLRNWSHIPSPTRPREEVRYDLGWQPGETVVLHAGAMGLKQGLENVVDAAARAADRHPLLRFVLMGDGNQRAMLMERGASYPNLRFVEPCPAEQFPDVLAAADFLLINERASLLDMALPSKLTSYLVAGRPIVAAVAPDGWTAREVQRSGAGVVVPAEQPNALVDVLAELAADADRRDRLAAAGPDYAARHLSPAASLANAERFIGLVLDGHAAPMPVLGKGALGD